MRNERYAFAGLGLVLWSGCVYYAAAFARPAPPLPAAPAEPRSKVQRIQAVWSGDGTRLYSAETAQNVGLSPAAMRAQEVSHD